MTFDTQLLLPQAVCLLLLNQNEEILAISRRDDPNAWGLPGGKVDPGETLEIAVVRETFEETGLVLAGVQPVFTAKNDGGEKDTTYMCTTFTGRIVGQAPGAPRSEPFVGDVKWVKPSVLEHSVFGRYNRELFTHIGLIIDLIL